MGRTFVFGKQGKTRKTGKNNVDYQCKVFIGFSGFYLFLQKIEAGKKRYIISQIILSIFCLLGALGCVILMFMMPEGFFLMLLVAALSAGFGYSIVKSCIRCITISDGTLYQEGIDPAFDITIQPDEVDYWLEEYNERVEYGITDNTVMLVKGKTIIYWINTRMLHDAERFKKALPWPYKGEYEKDMIESMWMGNTIKENNIKTPNENVSETERF